MTNVQLQGVPKEIQDKIGMDVSMGPGRVSKVTKVDDQDIGDYDFSHRSGLRGLVEVL